MKILVVSNLYPPFHIGGYELGCQTVVESLQARGHAIRVLTSSYGFEQVQENGEVYRALVFDLHWCQTNWLKSAHRLVSRELTNRSIFKKHCFEFKPDVVYFWNVGNISYSLIHLAQSLKLPTVCYISDSWLAEGPNKDVWFGWWAHQPTNRAQRFIKEAFASTILGPLGLLPRPNLTAPRNVQFTSEYIRQLTIATGQRFCRTWVIHWGVDTDFFACERNPRNDLLRLLFVGRIVPSKGVHTVIEALSILRNRYPQRAVELTVVGSCDDPDYYEKIKSTIRLNGLEEEIRIIGKVERNRLPSIYCSHDVLVFPSIWSEPFSIALLEGMCAGLAVVGTTSGGSSEILKHGDNALTFQKADAADCAIQIGRLLEVPDLLERYQINARKTIDGAFGIGRMTDQIEQSLLEVIDFEHQ